MRRHLTGLVLAVVMFLMMFFAGAWGYVRLLRLPPAASASLSQLPAGGGSLLGSTSVLASVSAVAVTGLMAGILIATPRISPLAAGLPGLIAIGWEVLYLGSVHHATQIIPLRSQAFGTGWEALLFNGVLGAVGLAMVVPLLVPARWRGQGGGGMRIDSDDDLDDAQDFVSGLKDSMASATVLTPSRVAGAPRTGLVGGQGGPGRPGPRPRPGR